MSASLEAGQSMGVVGRWLWQALFFSVERSRQPRCENRREGSRTGLGSFNPEFTG